MIPKEVMDIAELICPFMDELDDRDADEVVKSAQRIWDAGYRKEPQP